MGQAGAMGVAALLAVEGVVLLPLSADWPPLEPL